MCQHSRAYVPTQPVWLAYATAWIGLRDRLNWLTRLVELAYATGCTGPRNRADLATRMPTFMPFTDRSHRLNPSRRFKKMNKTVPWPIFLHDLPLFRMTIEPQRNLFSKKMMLRRKKSVSTTPHIKKCINFGAKYTYIGMFSDQKDA